MVAMKGNASQSYQVNGDHRYTADPDGNLSVARDDVAAMLKLGCVLAVQAAW